MTEAGNQYRGAGHYLAPRMLSTRKEEELLALSISGNQTLIPPLLALPSPLQVAQLIQIQVATAFNQCLYIPTQGVRNFLACSQISISFQILC